jgi:hypothetical protein
VTTASFQVDLRAVVDLLARRRGCDPGVHLRQLGAAGHDLFRPDDNGVGRTGAPDRTVGRASAGPGTEDNQ